MYEFRDPNRNKIQFYQAVRDICLYCFGWLWQDADQFE